MSFASGSIILKFEKQTFINSLSDQLDLWSQRILVPGRKIDQDRLIPCHKIGRTCGKLFHQLTITICTVDAI